jgi:hypothetical protein
MRLSLAILAVAVALAGATLCQAQNTGTVAIEDIFGRRLTDKNGLILVDWEGYIANPAIEFFIVPPASATFPVRGTISADEPRMYFNRPCETGAQGPRKELRLSRGVKQSVFVSIFPDRDDKDESHVITLDLRDAAGRTWQRKLPVKVIDQDRKDEGNFPFTVDFSYDKTGFFKDEKAQEVVRQAVRDWLYFFDPAGLDTVPAGAENSFVRKPDDLTKGDPVTNAREYTGFLVYAIGVHTSGLHSGGMPSFRGDFQSVGGKKLPIRRSGCVEIETEGNYNRRGWMIQCRDADWWKATNREPVQNDLYSIVHHELGHALFFNPLHTLVARAKNGEPFEDKRLSDYYGSVPKIDQRDHFTDQNDPASRRGLYGNEYKGEMPDGRWLPTKGDLLFAQAIGYRLRPTSAFRALTLDTDTIPAGRVGTKYDTRLRAAGGIPFYNWELAGGQKLPPGLKLDAFTGEIEGSPSRAGKFEFAVRVRDYQKQEQGVEKPFVLEVKP